ncbi:MAG: hypothetical protein FWE02_06865, partial [Defluviitaleaceae bacterium]|nr:hypothetical protein [Defluviitaleaceae bacterium]
MRWFSNLKIRAKVLLGVGVILVLLIGVSIFASLQLLSQSERYNDLRKGSIYSQVYALRMVYNMTGLRRTAASMPMHAPGPYVENIISLREEALVYVDGYTYYMDLLRTNIINDLSLNQNGRAVILGYITELETLVQIYTNTILGDVYNNAIAGNWAESRMGIISQWDNITRIVELLFIIDTLSVNHMYEQTAVIEADSQRDFIIVIALNIIFALIALVIGFILASGISRPVQRLLSLSKDIVAGRLNINTVQTTKDEIGELT